MQAADGRWGVDCFVSLRFFRLSKNILEVIGGGGGKRLRL